MGRNAAGSGFAGICLFEFRQFGKITAPGFSNPDCSPPPARGETFGQASAEARQLFAGEQIKPTKNCQPSRKDRAAASRARLPLRRFVGPNCCATRAFRSSARTSDPSASIAICCGALAANWQRCRATF